MIISSCTGGSGGEQYFLTTIALLIIFILFGVFILALANLVLYRSKTKKSLWIKLILIFISLYYLFPIFRGLLQREHPTVVDTKYIGGKKLDIETRYFPPSGKRMQVESIKYWINGQADSVWINYDKNGRVLTKTRYKQDKEIGEVK